MLIASALKFGSAGSNRVVRTTPTTMSSGTYCITFSSTDVVNSAKNLMSFGASGTELIRRAVDGTAIRFGITRATTSAVIQSVTGTLKPNVIQCAAVTWDINAIGSCRMYYGTLGSALADVTDMAGLTVGSGAQTTFTTFTVGCNLIATLSWPGLIWADLLSSAVLTLPEIAKVFHTWSPHTRGTLVTSVLAANGTGRVLDRSGNNNHGTITGAIPTNDCLPRILHV